MKPYTQENMRIFLTKEPLWRVTAIHDSKAWCKPHGENGNCFVDAYIIQHLDTANRWRRMDAYTSKEEALERIKILISQSQPLKGEVVWP